MWSWRFADTGQVERDVDVEAAQRIGRPIPDSIRSCGELTVPADRMTSRRARISSSRRFCR